MAETLGHLLAYLEEKQGKPAKIILWEHNSHVGDARATEIGETGEVNVGQLVREKYGAKNVFLVGFTTYKGTVTAASNWDEPERIKRVTPALPGSYEALFHELGFSRFLLPLSDHNTEVIQALKTPRLERAIGVIYHPETERISHYFYSRLPDQFDAVIHLDETHAVKPLDPSEHWEMGEVPETYPTGL